MKNFDEPKIFIRWAVDIPAVTLLLTFILSTGPHIQQYGLALLNSEMPSVYGSVYKEDLISFPSLEEWIKYGLMFPFLCMAFIIAIATTKSSEPKKVAWRCMGMSMLVLTIYDVSNLLYEKNFTIKSFSEIFASNLIGGIFLCSLVVGIFSIADLIYTNISTKKYQKKLAAIVFFPLAGITTSSMLYYMLDFFYSPKSANFEINFSAPAAGYIAPELEKNSSKPKNENKTKETSKESFRFFPAESISGNVYLQTVHAAPRLSFASNPSMSPKQVSVSFLSGCYHAGWLDKEDKATPWLTVDNVSEFEAFFDKGLTVLQTVNDEESKSQYTIKLKDYSIFNLKKETDSTKIAINQMLLEKHESLEISSNSREFNFFMSAPSIRSVSRDGRATHPRILTLKIGSKIHVIKLDPPRTASDIKKLQCSFYNPSDLSTEPGHKETANRGLIHGILISIKDSTDLNSYLANSRIKTGNTVYRVDDADGWLSIDDIPTKQLVETSLGTLRAFQINGNISELLLDGSTLTTNKLETYNAKGRFEIKRLQDGVFHISGSAEALWKNNRRMNKTKWERLELEMKIFLLTTIASIIAYFFTRMAKRLKSETKFAWTNSD